MPVSIEDDINGRLVLDLSDERELSTNPLLTDILLSFNVVSQTQYRLLIDIGGGDLVESLEYLQRSFGSIGIDTRPSAELSRLLERARQEMNLINSVRRDSGQPQAIASQPLMVPGLMENASLLTHQQRGLRQGLRIGNLAEFSVQGSGKTSTVLSAFSIWKDRGEVDKLLVIGPISCFVPWETEVQRCFGGLYKTMRWSGAISQRLRLVPNFGLVDIILCSYDTARSDVLMLRRLLKDSKTLLVLDESHYIKNIKIGARAYAAIQLAQYATRRMILTGTPAPHSLEDLWTQFTFLWPNGAKELLGNAAEYQEFLGESASPAHDLCQRLGPFYHRTTQDELKLPTAQSHFVSISNDEIPIEQRRIIQLLENRVLSDARLQLPNISDRHVLAQWQRARVTRLLQAASNPGLLNSQPDWPVDLVGDIDTSDLLEDVISFQTGQLQSAKIAWVVNKTRQLIAQGNKVLIWTWWVDNLHLLENLLSEYNPLLLFGAIKPYEEEMDEDNDQSRERNIREFKTRLDRQVLIANPSACAEAISLHRECHHAIYVDRTFNCGQFLQSLNRIHRVGLPEGTETHYWIPILGCAVEHVVDNRLRERQQVMYDFLGDETPIIGVDPIEENELTDTNDELNRDFNAIVGEINSDHDSRTTS